MKRLFALAALSASIILVGLVATATNAWSQLGYLAGIRLQNQTPGTPDAGHGNLSGTLLVGGRIGVGTNVPAVQLDVMGSGRLNAPQARLSFGPTDDCSIGIDPGIPGLILRDPIVRLHPNSGSARLVFGPTMDSFFDVFTDLSLRMQNPQGLRLMRTPGTNNALRVLFGPTDDCSIGISPMLSGLVVCDPGGLRVKNPDPLGRTRLLFGPTDDCSIMIDPQLPGLILRDPAGIRLSPPAGPSRLLFGPTDTMFIETELVSLSLTSVGGLRLRQPMGTNAPMRLLFGPTDDCSIGIDPVLSGLILRDPNVRINRPNPGPMRLLFGPTDDCSIGIDPAFPGLVGRDPRGLRLLNPQPMLPTRLLFGPTDDCSIGIDPVLTGLVARDPILRINPPNAGVTRMLFGPTDDCSIGIDPAMPGLILRDPSGIRILPPSGTPRLHFGPPTLDSFFDVFADLSLQLHNPRGLRLTQPPMQNAPLRLLFGPTDDCSIGIDPVLPGLILRDPLGFTLIGQNTRIQGNLQVAGMKQFRIDHPLDPENMYLNHYCTEGAEPLNAYSGNVTTDAKGEAWVSLPDWFEDINRDFRYSLTIVDDEDFAMARIAKKIENNRFLIKTNRPRVEVSWRVEGVRNDAWTRKHGAPVEVDKPVGERGKLQFPELYGKPPR